jgi:hypothetical protein
MSITATISQPCQVWYFPLLEQTFEKARIKGIQTQDDRSHLQIPE